MASIIQVGENWRAQVRRKGYRDQTDTFKTHGRAKAWATKIEASMDAGTFTDVRSLKLVNLAGLIDWYNDEIGGVKGFGKNKTAVLATLRKTIGHWSLAEINDDNMTQYVKDRHAAEAGGVTIAVDLHRHRPARGQDLGQGEGQPGTLDRGAGEHEVPAHLHSVK